MGDLLLVIDDKIIPNPILLLLTVLCNNTVLGTNPPSSVTEQEKGGVMTFEVSFRFVSRVNPNLEMTSYS